MRIFINGTLDSATTPATAANTPVATTAPVLIGGDSSTHRFSGTLDDVSIYGRALSDSEIADLANIVDRRYEYHHVNALGSNIVLTDDNQNVLVRYEYDIFGAIRSETGTCDNTRKFTGKEFDADSNLYYYGARYYDPYIGRFTQRDPIGDGGNWYTYTHNNPLKYTDPNGLQPVQDQAGEVGEFTEIMKYTKREVGKQVGEQAAGALRYLGERDGLKPAHMGPLTGNVEGRYVYTTKKGWVDMSHFLFYAGRAMIHQYEGKENPLELAVREGKWQELSDLILRPSSAYSYEDLPSNYLGADFAINYFNVDDSELTLSNQIDNYLISIGATHYENAPNWGQIPKTDTGSPPFWLNFSSTGMTEFGPPSRPSPPPYMPPPGHREN